MLGTIGLRNLTFLAVPGLHSIPLMAAYCIAAPIISILIIVMGAGAIFNTDIPSGDDTENIVGLFSLIWIWIIPGHARTRGSGWRLFYMIACACLYTIIHSPLFLLTIIIISSKWWWWLFREAKWTFISFYGRIPKFFILIATIFLSIKII